MAMNKHFQFQNDTVCVQRRLKMKQILFLSFFILFHNCESDAGRQWNTDGHHYNLREKLVFGQGRRRQSRPGSHTLIGNNNGRALMIL